MSQASIPKPSRYQQLQAQRAHEAAQLAQRRYHADANRLGQQIRDYRQTWNISQRHLAQLAGTTQSAIAHIEAGRANPTLKTLEVIAASMPGIELKISLGRSANPTPGAPR